MNKPITAIGQVTTEWLTERLRLRGHLYGSDVTKVEVVPSRSSEVARLEVEYSLDVSGLPSSFYLKFGSEDECVEREALFHRDMVSLMEAAPTVRWLDVSYEPESGRAHLLTEDVGRTHYQGKWNVSQSLAADGELLVDTMAPFHAYWWDHPRLGTEFGDFPRADNILFFHGVAGYERSLARVIDMLGNRFKLEWREIYERALASFPFKDQQGRARLAPGNRLTVVHGDVLPDNVFLPRDPTVYGLYLIDWAFWEVRVGTDDIANLGLLGFCDPKANLTRDLVQRYYDGLLQSGVQDYQWEDCWHDYRLSIIRNLFIPINSFRDSKYSWENLERSLLSFHDLECEELLTS